MNLISKFPGGIQVPRGVTNPSSMPTTDLPGWNYLNGEDFNTDFAEGQFRTVMGTAWDQYNMFPASPQNDANNVPQYEGVYNMAKTGSVTNSVLRIRCWKEAGQPDAWVGAPTPWGGIPQLYGRYSMRLRTTPTTNEDYKTAWLLWPTTNNWNDGEIDFPEMDLGGNIGGFSHDVNGTPRNNILGYQGNISSQNWHVLTLEWLPNRVTFIVDGNVVAQTTNSAGIPYKPMRWVLQTETSLERPHNIPVGSTADVYLDWVAVWAYAP